MIPEIKKILYATDLSPNSAYALRFALNSAILYNAEIVILHVLDRTTSGCAPIRGVYIDEQKYQALFDEHVTETKEKIENRLNLVYEKELKDRFPKATYPTSRPFSASSTRVAVTAFSRTASRHW